MESSDGVVIKIHIHDRLEMTKTIEFYVMVAQGLSTAEKCLSAYAPNDITARLTISYYTCQNQYLQDGPHNKTLKKCPPRHFFLL